MFLALSKGKKCIYTGSLVYFHKHTWSNSGHKEESGEHASENRTSYWIVESFNCEFIIEVNEHSSTTFDLTESGLIRWMDFRGKRFWIVSGCVRLSAHFQKWLLSICDECVLCLMMSIFNEHSDPLTLEQSTEFDLRYLIFPTKTILWKHLLKLNLLMWDR